MTYNSRKYPLPKWYNKPSSPSKRKERWVTLIIRSAHYSMLREMADYQELTIGQAAMEAIEKEFNKMLKEVDPNAEEYSPVYKPDKRKKNPFRKERSAASKKYKTIDEILASIQAEIEPDVEPEAPVEEPTAPEQEPVQEVSNTRRKIHVSRF